MILNKVFGLSVSVFVLLFSGYTEESLAGQENVRLAWAMSLQCPPVSGCYRDESLRGVVEVKNIDYRKKVEVYYKHAHRPQWDTAPATYVGSGDDGYEGWMFSVSGPIEEFAFSYQVNGKTFWDNNGGENYKPERYANDLLIIEGRGIAGINGFYSAPSGQIWGWAFTEPLSGKHSEVIISIKTEDDEQDIVAKKATEFSNGSIAWHFEGHVTPPVAEESVFIYTTLHSQETYLDNNYGSYYVVRDGRIAIK